MNQGGKHSGPLLIWFSYICSQLISDFQYRAVHSEVDFITNSSVQFVRIILWKIATTTILIIPAPFFLNSFLFCRTQLILLDKMSKKNTVLTLMKKYGAQNCWTTSGGKDYYYDGTIVQLQFGCTDLETFFTSFFSVLLTFSKNKILLLDQRWESIEIAKEAKELARKILLISFCFPTTFREKKKKKDEDEVSR